MVVISAPITSLMAESCFYIFAFSSRLGKQMAQTSNGSDQQ